MANAFGDKPIGLEAEVMNLAGILSRPYTMRMPPFQRPYTWGVEEVAKLIEDLRAAFLRKASYYFIGQIVFVKEGLRFLDICDGQQRLTTLTILLAYARDRLPQLAAQLQTLIIAGGTVGRIRLRPADAPFYERWVHTPGRIDDMAALKKPFQNEAQEALAAAAECIRGELGPDEMNDAELTAFVRYIARCATFNVIDADEIGGAATVFETMHNRGKPLSPADIVKGALLKDGLSPEEVREGARIWDHYEERAGRDNFARLLHYMPLLLRAGPIISPGDVAALVDTIERRISVRKFFTEWLPRHGEAFLELVHGAVAAGVDSADINRRVRCLHLVAPERWEPLAIAYLVAHGPGERAKAQRFFQIYERFICACVLNAVDTKSQRTRPQRVLAHLDDEKQIEAALELTPRMQRELRNNVAQPSSRKPLRRYLVLRVNAAMGEVLTIHADACVEHVLPATPTPWWRQQFASVSDYGEYANLLGNYVLLTDRQNDEAGNKPYPDKRDFYFNRGYPERAITRDIKPILEWTPRALDERHERLVRVLWQDWDLGGKAG